MPQPFGGKYRQIQVYVDPLKVQAHQLSLMDVVHSVNQANAILPAGDVRIGAEGLQYLHERRDADDGGSTALR